MSEFNNFVITWSPSLFSYLHHSLRAQGGDLPFFTWACMVTVAHKGNITRRKTFTQYYAWARKEKVCWIIINNYWMRLSMISWIIKTEVCVICQSRRLRQITQTWGFDNSWYHAKTKFNNCFVTHFSHNSSSETEARRSAILSLRRTLQGA